MDMEHDDYVKLKNIHIFFPIKHNNAYVNDKIPWYHPFVHGVKMPVNSFPHSTVVHSRLITN